MTNHPDAGATIVTKTATTLTYTGSAGAIVSGVAGDTVLGMTASQWSVFGVIGGLVIAALGFGVNVYFKWRHFKLAEKSAKADPDE